MNAGTRKDSRKHSPRINISHRRSHFGASFRLKIDSIMTEYEMIKKWAELSNDTMSKDAHRQMADNYEKLAEHYDELAAEARRHAEAHRVSM